MNAQLKQRRKRQRRQPLRAARGWETVAKVIDGELRQARRAKMMAFKGGIRHIEALKYWIDYIAALSRIRALLKAEMKPSPNEKGQP